MRRIQTDVLVIGGGATGTGILRDLSMRGLSCVLVEKRDLASGTTGRYHGLLHSGGRYVVKDPSAARECIQENRILRHILPSCVEDTGGFFVLTPGDDPNYIPEFINGCHNAEIPVEEISIRQMLKEEPVLNPKIERCFRVPDASADSFLAADLNAESARLHGAKILLYHEVLKLSTNTSSSTSSNSVTGAICHDLVKDEEVEIDASYVVNASGAWAGKIVDTAGINLQMLPGKGTMVAVNHRIVNTVINRCKPPSDGDILVPAHTVAVMGTTDIRVVDPDVYSIEPWEIRLMLDEGEKLVPGFKSLRVLRAWAGVRPLVQASGISDDRDISRAFTLIDHSGRDGIDGLITITGGKWTTYRKMAEVTVDNVCDKLHTTRPCRTHLEVLPTSSETVNNRFYVGSHLKKVEIEKSYGHLVCECELASIEEVEHAIIEKDALTIDDIRRDVRLGMGPCQAAFCAFRAAGILHNIRRPPIADTNTSLRTFLQERWKGNLPILWGQQLRQQRFNELIYINNLNINELKSKPSTQLYADDYSKPAVAQIEAHDQPSLPKIVNQSTTFTNPAEVVVIGAGLSGLISGWMSSAAGKKTHIITKGWGAPYWSSGCIDVFGYKPPDYSIRISSPRSFLQEFIGSNPKHPYAAVGIDLLEEAIDSFIQLSKDAGYPYEGTLETNLLLPSALGTLRPTCLAPFTMIAGDMNSRSPSLIVGFNRYLDFFPAFISDNLTDQGYLASDVTLNIETLNRQKFLNPIVLARLFDKPEFRVEVIDALKPRLGNAARLGFPAVLGLGKTKVVIHHLETALGVKVFEIPGLPPSVPGIRLQNMLTNVIQNLYGIIDNGMEVTSADIDNHHISSVWSEASSRRFAHPAENYILATGGFLGGGFSMDNHGYAKETVFGLPINRPGSRLDQFQDQFLSRKSHPIYSHGLNTNRELRPLDESDQVMINNLLVVGNGLGGCDPLREFSLEGIALATGYKAGKSLTR